MSLILGGICLLAVIGLVFWFGRQMKTAGENSVKAKSGEDGIEKLNKINQPVSADELAGVQDDFRRD